MKAQEMLRRAAALFRRGKWMRGWGDRETSCALGTIGIVNSGEVRNWNQDPESIKAVRALAKNECIGVYDDRINLNILASRVIEWNDNKATGPEQVACVFETTAQRLEDEEKERENQSAGVASSSKTRS